MLVHMVQRQSNIDKLGSIEEAKSLRLHMIKQN